VVLFGYKKERPWEALLVVILASCWAGISRINWYPLPGALAALLYVLETPLQENEKGNFSLKQPLLLLCVGVVCAFLSNLAYIPLSGNSEIQNFTTSLTSDLLWYRLLPSPTFPKGILTGILWLTSPLLVLFILRMHSINAQFNKLQKLYIGAILLVFFVGGLFVSVKIGGGSNLHNMDAFMLLLLVSVYYVCFSDNYPTFTMSISHTLSIVLMLVLLMQPLFWSLSAWNPRRIYSGESLQHDLAEINGMIGMMNDANPESKVLFINQRQLLTFKYETNTSLIPEYELLELMEMAISNQTSYLEKFYADLAEHKYDMIVANKQYVIFKGKEDTFPEENNAWVNNITLPLLTYYKPISWLRYTDTEIYIPRSENELKRIITQ